VKKAIVAGAILALCAMTAAAQGMSNEAVIKMAKAGLGEDIIVSTIKTQPGKYATGLDDLIALKTAGVSDKVIAAMMEKTATPAVAAPTAMTATVGGGAAPIVSEVGVYFKKGDVWADLPPEVVNFKSGGVLKQIGTAGIVKGDKNGHLNGEHSHTQLKTPVSLLVYTPEGVAISEYQLVRLREQKDSREFRTVTGGVLHESGGATRDLIQFESKKIAPRTYEVALPNIGSGEFGLLPPAGADATASSGRLGKIYSFRVIE
jgi:hypothetical protein